MYGRCYLRQSQCLRWQVNLLLDECVCVWHTVTLRPNTVCNFRSDAALAYIPVHLDFSAAVLPSGAAAVLLLLQDVYAPQEHLLPSHSTPGSHSGTLYSVTCFKLIFTFYIMYTYTHTIICNGATDAWHTVKWKCDVMCISSDCSLA